jgi:hypothetical protein
MILVLVIVAWVAAWVAAGVVNAGLMGGWRYYRLYPRYAILGTPDEQWERDGFDALMWGIALSAGPVGLLINPFIFGMRLKY